MGVKLFEHNQAAYEAALRMMEKTKRAAVVHPTGTGKSFIALKLCEDNPGKTVCWLSPSEHIFRTQGENWERAGGRMPGNIRFCTYARLMLMGREEMEAAGADYLVLDEFHRCGAQMWGRGVERLLGLYPGIPVLGLSATSIRYLDSRRDMADELFDGNVASEMTLGDAIVRGILNPPRYVLSVYSYQKDLERCEKRVRSAKNRAVRDAGEKCLEALRRALERAEGLEDLFYRYMVQEREPVPDGGREAGPGERPGTGPAGCGKYIVFCADVGHLHEMAGVSRRWFRRVDPEPRIYMAYSDAPEAGRAFADFKADDSRHLKLLFCINMLNEGIHVDDVDGVVLLRPTVSPAVYKQQIGRALSAGGRKNAVIFDIVMNIENLCSIDAVRGEMQEAAARYRSAGLPEEIVNGPFRVYGEARDCMELFRRLNETLGAPWEAMYAAAERYYGENGNLEVPKRYVTEEGYSLGQWVNTQRRIYGGKAEGTLTGEQIRRLEGIGMRWQDAREAGWEKYYAAAQAYAREHGNLLAGAGDGPYRGVRLGRWLAQLRTCRKNGVPNGCLTPGRTAALDALGMVWDVREYQWEKNFRSALRYYRENGDLDVPCAYVDPEGVRLGAWTAGLRSGKKAGLTGEQVRRLEEIGMSWESRHEAAWEKSYAAACRYREEHGDLEVPASYVTGDGCPLGRWIRSQRDQCKNKKKLSAERRQKLEAIGMVWETGGRGEKPGTSGEEPGEGPRDAAWKRQYGEAERFYRENGHLEVPGHYPGADGKDLHAWLARQREKHEKGTLGQEKTAMLGRIGMEWEAPGPWEAGYGHAEEYFHEKGNLCIPAAYVCPDGYRLGKWVQNQRAAYHRAAGKGLSRERTRKLEEIGMVWDAAGHKWKEACREAERYYREHGNLEVPPGYRTALGTDLSGWLAEQRKAGHEKRLDGERKEMLEAIGMDWLLPAERRWEEAYASAVRYRDMNGNLSVPGSYRTESGYCLGRWIGIQRRRKAGLKAEQVRKLDAIGMVWEMPGAGLEKADTGGNRAQELSKKINIS